jgi:ATP-dependent RNA helicase DHX57
LEGMVREPGKGMSQREQEVVSVVRNLVERDGLDA